MTQNANVLQSSLQHTWQHCFDDTSVSACSSPGISCCASASWEPHSVCPVKAAGAGIGSGSECRTLLWWAGCEQLSEPAPFQCSPFLSHTLLICTAAAPQALWAKAAGKEQIERLQCQGTYAWHHLGYNEMGAKALLATWKFHPAIPTCIAGMPGTALAACETDRANIADKMCSKPELVATLLGL